MWQAVNLVILRFLKLCCASLSNLCLLIIRFIGCFVCLFSFHHIICLSLSSNSRPQKFTPFCTDPSLHLHQIGRNQCRFIAEASRKSASTSQVIVLKQTSNSHSFTPVFSVPRPGIYPREDFSDDDHPLYHLECFQGRLSEHLMSFIAFASGSYESYSGSRVNVVDTLRDTVTLQLSLL